MPGNRTDTEKNPILQSGIKDWMKSIEERIQALTTFLEGGQ